MDQVIYYSKKGNTRKLAEAAAQALGVTALAAGNTLPAGPADTLFVCGSVYGGRIDPVLADYLKALPDGQARRVAVLSTAAGKKTPLAEIRAIFQPKSVRVLDEEFHCRGSFLFVNRGRPNAEDCLQAQEFAKRIAGLPAHEA